MKYYVAYGSNMNIEQMSLRCPDAVLLGTSSLNNHQIVFRTHATVEPKEGHSVPVVIWGITDNDERRLDKYEGYPTYYRKEYISIVLETMVPRKKQNIRAMIYVMNKGFPIAVPSKSYYEVIRNGYLNFGLDEAPIHDALVNAAYISNLEHFSKEECE